MGCGKGWVSIGNSEDAALGGSQGPAGPSGMPARVPVGNSCLVPLQLGLCPGFFRQSGASSLPWVCPEPEEPQSPSMPSLSCPAVQQRARTDLSSMHGKSCRIWGGSCESGLSGGTGKDRAQASIWPRVGRCHAALKPPRASAAPKPRRFSGRMWDGELLFVFREAGNQLGGPRG